MSTKKARVYTKTGDKGETSLFGGKRVSKDSLRIKAIGDLDELNASLGVVLSAAKTKQTQSIVTSIQNTLFNIGAELANPELKGKNTNKIFKLEQGKVSELEKIIDQIDTRLKPLSNFILPGGVESASRLHFTRGIARRTERSVIELSQKEKTNPNIISYTNRLSDLLFTLARNENRLAKTKETSWKKD